MTTQLSNQTAKVPSSLSSDEKHTLNSNPTMTRIDSHRHHDSLRSQRNIGTTAGIMTFFSWCHACSFGKQQYIKTLCQALDAQFFYCSQSFARLISIDGNPYVSMNAEGIMQMSRNCHNGGSKDIAADNISDPEKKYKKKKRALKQKQDLKQLIGSKKRSNKKRGNSTRRWCSQQRARPFRSHPDRDSSRHLLVDAPSNSQ